MRVTGGSYRGRRLEVPTHAVRPATDRMREAVFNIIGAGGAELTGSRFLDLFSGSGSMAVEAASRGAAAVDLVERDPRKRPFLLRNTSFLSARVAIHITPCERFLHRVRRSASDNWNLVFADPPYAYRHKNSLLAALAGLPLSVEALVMMHVPAGETLAAPAPLVCVDRRRYGGGAVCFFRAAEREGEESHEPDTPAPPAGGTRRTGKKSPLAVDNRRGTSLASDP